MKKQKQYLKKLKNQNKLTQIEKISLRREKIEILLNEGLKQKDIISILCISRYTYISDMKIIKEQALI